MARQRVRKLLRSLSNANDDDSNENGKRQVYTFFPSLHARNVKVPNFTFGRREHETTIF